MQCNMLGLGLLILIVTICSGQNKTSNSEDSGINASRNNHTFKRWYCFDGPIPNVTHSKRCCKNELKRYRRHWFKGAFYLTSILERLRSWKCREFQEECDKPTWPFSEYTNLIYDLFCNRSKLELFCLLPLKDVVLRYEFVNESSISNIKVVKKKWKILSEALNSDEMQLDDLINPCVQVALFDRKDGGVGRFHEIVEFRTPFCGVQWNGYDYTTAMYRDVSPWTGTPPWCKSSIIVCMVVMVMTGIATIFANLVILTVFGMTPELRNSQTIYKISLAISDLGVGLVIWPNMIVMQYKIFFQPRTMGSVVKYPSDNNSSWTQYFPVANQTLIYRYPGGNFKSIFSIEYILFIGFFTSFSLFLSIYILMIASFDRLSAISRPLQYNKHVAKRYAKIACYILWLLAGILSTLPIVIKRMQYTVSLSNFIISEGDIALVILFIGLFFPLVITWIVTISTYLISKKQVRQRPGETLQCSSSDENAIERRIALTLTLMIGTFTACIIPAIFCILLVFYPLKTNLGSPSTFDPYSENVYITAEYISVIILTSNSLWNCFIYGLRTHGFGKATRKVFSRFLVKTRLGKLWSFILSGFRSVCGREGSISTNNERSIEITPTGITNKDINI